MRRFLRPLSAVLVVIGALLLADAVTTLVWQEPVSALYSRLQQGQLDDKLAKLEGTEPTAVDRKVLSRLGTLDRRLAYAARALNRRTDDGQPLGRIRIPSIGVSSVVVAGTGTSDLRLGPGHYPGTPLPGARGTVAIAGHRTTYGAPFRKLDKVNKGDRIEVRMPYGTFVVPGRAEADRRSHGALGDPPHELRPADPVGLPPAVLGRAADRRVRAADRQAAEGRPPCLTYRAKTP